MKNQKQLKQFIAKFNYPDPKWNNLPVGFPNCDTKGLTPHEEGLYGGIVLIWYANHGGRPALYKMFTQSLAMLTVIVAGGIMIRNILVSDMFTRAVTVNAATVSGTLRSITAKNNNEYQLSPSQVLESTVSGLLKKEVEK